jgi:TatD DNase family protein
VAERDPRISLTVGIHPHDTGRAAPEDLDRLAKNLGHPRVCAVGETGLDYFRDYAPSEAQQEFFRRHVGLARETGLPLVVHARTGPGRPPVHGDVFRILEEEGRGRVRGVLHCFSGGLAEARLASALGFCLGIGGAITYHPRRSGPLLAAIAGELGPEVFVLETDCPWLPPQPHRGTRNEPAYVPLVAAALAGYLGCAVAEVDRVTDASARALFRLPSADGI